MIKSRIVSLILLSAILVSCTPQIYPVKDAPIEQMETPTTPEEPKTAETPTAPDSPTIETPTIPEVAPVPIQEPEKPKEKIMIKPIKNYSAYIVDQCGTIWGVPSFLQSYGHLERIVIETDKGEELPPSSIKFFTLEGVLYVEHSYAKPVNNEGTPPIGLTDYYKQLRGTDIITLVDDIPEMPASVRAQFDSSEWLVESSVISGVPTSYLYNRNAEIDPSFPMPEKGWFICRRSMIDAFIPLDLGILVMTENGAEFCPKNRTSMNAVSEPGRMWK